MTLSLVSLKRGLRTVQANRTESLRLRKKKKNWALRDGTRETLGAVEETGVLMIYDFSEMPLERCYTRKTL